jgi:hypothetical protein
MTSPADLDALVSNLTTAMLAKGKGPSWLHPAEHWVLNAIFDREVNRLARSERGTPGVVLTPQGQASLLRYLQGPLRDQLQRELGRIPGEVGFVYGHTHKPFVESRSVAGFSAPVQIFNTGGWVVDTATPSPVQAGVAVLIDDQLDVAALQFYRQGASPTPVQLLGPPDGATASPWQRELASRIDPTAEPWASISASATEVAAQRHLLQSRTVAAHLDAARAAKTAASGRRRGRQR